MNDAMMNDAILMSFNELSKSLGALLFPGEGGERGFFSVGIDSRNLESGALFIALPGTVHDGHSFIEAALKAGAEGIMASRSALETFNLLELLKKWGKTLILVEDTLKGLQNAAGAYLEKFPGLLKIAVTGSSGKTTTKEIAAAMTGQEKKVVMNHGNLNSETGLPLSVFNIRKFHEVGIFEAGMNRRGEIAELARVLKPDIALITNIGSAHIGILGSKEAIAEEKKAIFSQFTGNEKALIPSDEEYRDFLARNVAGEIRFYGPESFPELGGLRDLGLEGTEITWSGKNVNFPLAGSFNLKNAFSALAIAQEIPLSEESIRKGLESVKPLFGRGEILSGNVTVIRDCYNSNPESLKAALEFCAGLDWPGRKVYVVGSMLELGQASEEAHLAIGPVLASSGGDMNFLFGKETGLSSDFLSAHSIPFYWADNMSELKKALGSYVKNGDLVLLKGSRGCELEQLSPLLTGGRM